MRVNELAKEIGKSSKEVLEVLQQKNQNIKSGLSNVTEEQIAMVKDAFAPKAAPKKETAAKKETAKPAAGKKQAASEKKAPASKPAAEKKPADEASSIQAKAPAAKSTPAQKNEKAAQKPDAEKKAAGPAQTAQAKAPAAKSAPAPEKAPQTAPKAAPSGSAPAPAKAQADSSAPQPKKKVVAVYRPQNSQQRPARPKTQNTTASSRPANNTQTTDRTQQRDARPRTPEGSAARQADQQRRSSQPSAQARPGQTQAPSQAQKNTQDTRRNIPNRDQQGGSRTGTYQGNRDSNRQPRSGQGTYQGNRDQQGTGRTGTYQGSRDNTRQPRSGQGTYQGNRDGQGRTGTYQGNRDGQGRTGGYQGNRDGQGRTGTSSRQGQGRGGFDTQVQNKPGTNRQASRNIHKNDRFDRKNVTDDGPRAKGGKVSKHPFNMPPKPVEKKEEDTVKVITLPETITIKELAEKMKLQPAAIIKKLFMKGEMVTMNSELSYDKAEEIALDYDILCEPEEKVDVIAELLKEDEEDESSMVTRPPVVCVMGHVDHGKTSLLDAIRSTNVTAGEAGGITQHIGAYTVEVNGRQITFLDTPGHEAFTAMRMRGAQSTDIAVLVVAADDGVMPQTIEAINHAKAAGVEIIVAINKIDKPSANVEKVKQELMEYELVAEEWGGSTIFVPVSAKTKEGIPELLEMILLQADVMELKANPDRLARGVVIEAQLDKGKGPVANLLVQKGTLHVGDYITAGPCYGRVRAMMDDKGNRVQEAGPSMPVEVLGLNDVPGAGDILMATENEKDARSCAETFIAESKNKMLEETKMKMSLDDLFDQIKAGNVKELPIVVKADVQGSVEAVRSSLLKLSNDEVVVKVIHGGVGAINESDVSLAAASNAIIIGFNVRPDPTAKSLAEEQKVDMRLYRVIYQAIEDVEAAMKGMLEPVYEEQVIGHAVVRQLFKASAVGTIAGSYVTDGKIVRSCSCRVYRRDDLLFDGQLASLKRFKDDVKEVAAGYECGLVFEKFNDVQVDDTIEAYTMVEVPR